MLSLNSHAQIMSRELIFHRKVITNNFIQNAYRKAANVLIHYMNLESPYCPFHEHIETISLNSVSYTIYLYESLRAHCNQLTNSFLSECWLFILHESGVVGSRILLP